MKLPSIKIQLIIFLILFAFLLSIKDKDALFLLTTFIAIVSAICVESLILYFKNRKFTFTDSSIISGLIIGLVLSSDEPWWIFALASLLAIISKHLLKIKGKHLFNPAALGIFLITVLFGVQTQWKGTYLWYVLVPFGLYFIYKIRKLELLISYCLTAIILFGVQATVQKTPLLDIFGYLSYFYIFMMLIEPKTTPISQIGKLIFGMAAAILIFILTENGVKFDAELCALLVLNPFTPLLNKIPKRRIV